MFFLKYLNMTKCGAPLVPWVTQRRGEFEESLLEVEQEEDSPESSWLEFIQGGAAVRQYISPQKKRQKFD